METGNGEGPSLPGRGVPEPAAANGASCVGARIHQHACMDAFPSAAHSYARARRPASHVQGHIPGLPPLDARAGAASQTMELTAVKAGDLSWSICPFWSAP